MPFDVTFPDDLFLEEQAPLEVLTFTMRAFESNAVNDYVTWQSENTPDFVGTDSPFNPIDLADIIVVTALRPVDVGQAVQTVAFNEAATGTDGTRSLGAFPFGTVEWRPGARFRFGGVLSTSNASFAAQLQLYNITDAELVSLGGPTVLTTTNLGPTIVESPDLVIGAVAGRLRTAKTVYEVRLSSASASGFDIATLDSAWMRVF